MAHRNMATFIAATNLTELLDRMAPGDLTLELLDKHRFAIEVARAIEGGGLNGPGTTTVLEYMAAAYADILVAFWEATEERYRLNQAFGARQAAEAEALSQRQAIERNSLDDVLALYKVGQQLTVRYEKWAAPRAAEVTKRTWREAGSLPAAWVYDLKTDDGTYTWAETDTDWDVDVA